MSAPFWALLLLLQRPVPDQRPPLNDFQVVELMRKSADLSRRREEAEQKERAEAARKACAAATEAMLAAGDLLQEARLAVRADYRASHDGATVNVSVPEHEKQLWERGKVFWKAAKRFKSSCIDETKGQ